MMNSVYEINFKYPKHINVYDIDRILSKTNIEIKDSDSMDGFHIDDMRILIKLHSGGLNPGISCIEAPKLPLDSCKQPLFLIP